MLSDDDRIATLERKVTKLELQRMQDESKAKENIPSAQVFNLKETKEDMSILLGLVTTQEETTRELKDSAERIESLLDGFDRSFFNGLDRRVEDLDGRLIFFEHNVNKRFDAIDQLFNAHDQRFDAHDKRFDEIDQRFDAHDKRFDEIDQRFDAHDKRFDEIDQRFDAHDKRFDGIDQHLDSLDKKFDQVLLMLSTLTSGSQQGT
jgi:chromosome segregation ATPase